MQKRILFVTWSLTLGGGESRIITDIINNLNKEKYKIDILEFNRGTKKIDIKEEITFLKPIVDHTSEDIRNQRKELSKYIHNPSEITSLFDTEYDWVIACNRGNTTFIGSFIPSKKRISWILGSVSNLDINNIIDNKRELIVKEEYQKHMIAFNQFDKIITVSDESYDSFIKLFPIHSSKLIKIYNNIDIEAIKKKVEDNNYPLMDSNMNILVNMARLVDVKNQKLLIDVMKKVSDVRKDVQLIIIGDGLLYNELDEYIKELKVEDSVKLMGFYANPFPLLKKCKIFCLSSITEGFCLSLAEACALGLPFISTNVGGASELLSITRCGLIADNTVNDYVAKIEMLLNNENLYNELKNNSVIAADAFDIKNLIPKIEQLLDN